MGALAGPASAQPADDACHQVSPSASPCVGADKLAEAAAAECRRLGLPEGDCVLPLGHEVTSAARDAYRTSWVHRAAQFQYELGAPLPLHQAQWLGTHNSFNSVNDTTTISHTDSNQQLSLGQQLDLDMRSLELDVHWIPSAEAGGSNAVVVCHGRGPDQANLGCTNERTLADVLPEVTGWLNAPEHRDQVVLLYLEDELGDPAGYAETIRRLDAGLRRPDGRSLIYRPDPARFGTKGCQDMPLDVSRAGIRASGAQVMLVGNCRSGWASDVFSWDDTHVESGSTPQYAAFPACDASYPRSVYDAKLVRYYEDSTWVSSTVNPTASPQDAADESLTPDRVAAMTRCGVNLFGFDQLLPADGRIEASIWSWAPNQPDRTAGDCAAQRADGRWITRPCNARRRAACISSTGWSLTRGAVPNAAAATACHTQGAALGLPRTGYQNSLLRRAAGADEVWLGYRLPSLLRLACRRSGMRVACTVSGARSSRARARLVSGRRVLARATAGLRGGRGAIVLRPVRLGRGGYQVIVASGDAQVRRPL
ncbi:MAG: hypothetical protein QOH11_1479, partial [Solirubrobacteraceae bacterium]|nr:hypothetical protein [Solirubrobacteraceae bacterium]